MVTAKVANKYFQIIELLLCIIYQSPNLFYVYPKGEKSLHNYRKHKNVELYPA